VLLKVLDATLGLRVSDDQESEGLDVASHGERGYSM
jgi:Amt family ammonium transporter